jgi:hypothetical protein
MVAAPFVGSHRFVNNAFNEACDNWNMPAQTLESFSCKHLLKPPTLDLDDHLSVAMPIAPPQPWPDTPFECWPASHSCIASSIDDEASWELAATMLSAPFVPPPVDEATWLQPVTMQPLPPPASPNTTAMSESSTQLLDPLEHTKYDSVEIVSAPKSSAVLKLADVIVETEVGTAECPTVGSWNHRFGTCKPCAFFQKQGCGNGADCPFCHLCDAGEKKRRQKIKKMQLRGMSQEMEAMASVDAELVSTSCKSTTV